MTSPRQKKKKLAILKMLKKQKDTADQKLEKAAVEEMKKINLQSSEKHDSDLIIQKQLDTVTDKNKLGLKEIKNKKLTKTVNIETVDPDTSKVD